MNLSDYKNITNSFLDVHLISLRTWKHADEIEPCDVGGPYVVAQWGFDPADLGFDPDEFLLGRGGAWIPTRYFFQMPILDRRAEYIFGTAAEVMALMEALGGQVQIVRPDSGVHEAAHTDADEMLSALETGKRELPNIKHNEQL